MDTFSVSYIIRLEDDEDIDTKIGGICYEQSVEMPAGTVSGDIRERIVGKVISCEPSPLSGHSADERVFNAIIRWPLANTGNEITQFLNVLYGNISMKPGICITGVDWDSITEVFSPDSRLFAGPACGIDGIRSQLNIPVRGLSATALKPMGLSASELGAICYEFAAGGIDIIKDDHGLADQVYAPFAERIKSCTDAIKRASDETGRLSAYIPNITAAWPEMMRRYELALEAGAGGVMISPHITGLPALDHLARQGGQGGHDGHDGHDGHGGHDGFGGFGRQGGHGAGLPVIAHPAFSGSYTSQVASGFSKPFLYGELWRALGADMVIYPNAGGRFSFSREECLLINESARKPMGGFRGSFPMPGGGIQRENLTDLVRDYGRDTVYLLGGSLYQHPAGIRQAAREIHTLLVEAG